MANAIASAPIAAPTPMPAFAPVLSSGEDEAGDVGPGIPGVEPGDAVCDGPGMFVAVAVNLILNLEASAEAY